MASLLTQTDIDSFTGDFKNLFDTFKRQFVIHREPQKIVSQVNTTLYAGYKPQNQITTSFIPISGIFDGMIRYDDEMDGQNLEQLKTNYYDGSVRIKVERPAHDYLKQGKVQKVTIDDNTFRVKSGPAVKYFFGFRLYVYHLEETR